MSSLSFRQKDIIKYLLSQEEHVSVKQISKLFNISEKTIYRDLDSIQDKVLKENMSIEKKMVSPKQLYPLTKIEYVNPEKLNLTTLALKPFLEIMTLLN